jgi:diguanylate cyclase (GGDEF)-like protein
VEKRTWSFVRKLSLRHLNPAHALLAAIAAAILVCALDFFTPNELSLSLFYLIPVVVCMLFVSRTAGYSSAVLCGIAWITIQALNGRRFSTPFYLAWSVFVRIGTNFLFAFLLDILRRVLEDLREMSFRDPLTGAANRRYFEEFLGRQIDRSLRDRQPLTLLTLDIDDFKSLNDRFGHAQGDAALVALAQSIQSGIRPDDMLARMGGDEFVVLLYGMDYDISEIVGARLAEAVREGWSAIGVDSTLSMGMISYPSESVGVGAHAGAEAMLDRADRLMFEVKRSGKNGRNHVRDEARSADQGSEPSAT